MVRTRPAPTPLKRKVGLDEPCRICGQEIYFGYKGPVEGVCGRCTDRIRGTGGPRRTGQRMTLPRRERTGAGTGLQLALFVLGFVVGFLVHHFVPRFPF